MLAALVSFQPNEVILLRKRYLTLVCVLMMSSAVAQPGSGDTREQVVSYSPHVISLAGVLRKEHRFGPPGFGENPKTDPRVSIVVLKLDRPLTAVPDPKASKKDELNTSQISNIKAVQLWFSGDAVTPSVEKFARRHIGQRVRVEGVIDEAVAPMEFTTLILTVSRLVAER